MTARLTFDEYKSIKVEAKMLCRDLSTTHVRLLNEYAQHYGYATWGDLAAAHREVIAGQGGGLCSS